MPDYVGTMVIVFDVDGTLIGGEEQDWPSFENAIHGVFGFFPDRGFWDSMEEVTGRAILRKASEVAGLDFKSELEEKTCNLYLKNLRKAAPFKNTVFQPKLGAVEIISLLKQTSVFDVAVATGDFKESSQFKLASAGLDLRGVAYASSSDAELRKDIITKAVERAGGNIVDAIYVGDGVWDLRACRQLDIPFIGTGINMDRLKKAGAEFLVDDLLPSTLLPILSTMMG